MHHAACIFVGWASLAVPAALAAEERVWPLCEETAPGESGTCVEDTLEVVFPEVADPASDSILEYETFEAGREVEVRIVTETRSDRVQGWSYGVAHDGPHLEILSVTTAGTAVDPCRGFDATRFDGVETCGVDPECRPEGRTPGGGFISAYVFLCGKAYWLPVKRNVIAQARYRFAQEPGPEGTVLRLSDRLADERSPRAPFNVTVDGQSRLWTTAVDGWVKPAAQEAARFVRGDANDDARIDVSDAVSTLMVLAYGATPSPCWKAADADDDGSVQVSDAIFTLRWLLLGGERPLDPFPACGVDSSPDDLACPPGAGTSCR